GIRAAVRLPVLLGHVRIGLGQRREGPHPVEQRLYHVARGGAGSPCASSQDTTGLRRTPIFSISASITSPGCRYSAAASSENPATPDTVPVDSTSPAE